MCGAGADGDVVVVEVVVGGGKPGDGGGVQHPPTPTLADMLVLATSNEFTHSRHQLITIHKVIQKAASKAID